MKSFTIRGLPLGTGSCMGSFVRSLYLTAATRPAIIGLNIGNLGTFSKLGANSAIALDVVRLIITGDYTINPELISDKYLAGDTDIGKVYTITVSNRYENKITREDFSKIFTGPSTTEVMLTEPIELSITFYICNVTGLVTENIADAAIASIDQEGEQNILPCVCTGRHISDCWSTVEQNQFTEDVTVHLNGPTPEIEQDDANHIVELFQKYVLMLLDSLESLK